VSNTLLSPNEQVSEHITNYSKTVKLSHYDVVLNTQSRGLSVCKVHMEWKEIGQQWMHTDSGEGSSAK